MCLSSGNAECRYADGGLDVRHVSGQNGRLRSYQDFTYHDFTSCDDNDLGQLETTNAEMPMGATMFATCPGEMDG
jgi:hypothetical protein